MSNIYADYNNELEKLDLHFVIPTKTETIITTGISKNIKSLGCSKGDIELGVDNITGYMGKYKISDSTNKKVKIGYNGGTDNSYGGFVEMDLTKKDKHLQALVSTSGKTQLQYKDDDLRLSMGQELLIGNKNIGFTFSSDRIGFNFNLSR